MGSIGGLVCASGKGHGCGMPWTCSIQEKHGRVFFVVVCTFREHEIAEKIVFIIGNGVWVGRPKGAAFQYVKFRD